MAKAKKKCGDFDEVVQLGIQRGVADNPLFISTAKNYEILQKAILAIEKEIDSGEAVVTKEYVKSRENQYTNPAIKDLPKLTDASNKTVATLMDIIERMGSAAEPDALTKFCGS